MRLERDAWVVRKCGADPKVGHRSDDLRFGNNCRNIDAMRGEQVSEWIEVERRHSERSAASVARGDLSSDGVGPAEKGRDELHVSRAQRTAHPRRGDGLGKVVHSLVHSDREAVTGAQRMEHRRIAGSGATEAEVATHMHPGDGWMARHQQVHKGVGRHTGERLIEGQSIHAAQTQRSEDGVATIGRLKPEGLWRDTLEESHRVRLEGNGNRLGPCFSRLRHCSLDEASVAQMHTVEVTDGDDSSLIRRLHRLRVPCGEWTRRASARSHLGRRRARCQMFAAGRYAVVGAEVAGSASPAMQNAALEAVGMQPSYEAHSLTAAELPLYLRRASAEGFRGLNFTAPYKTDACTAAKVCSSVVQATGAANTWRLGPRGAEAFNTDTDGIWAMLTAYGALSAGQRVVLLGAGGAARAAAFVLGQWADAVLVINRTPAHARALCASQTLHPENRARWQVLQLQHPGDVSALQEAFADAALVIDAVGNRTAARATGHESRLPWRALDHRAELFDLSYGSAPSPLSLWTGRAAFDGATMLLHQGAASFELWTGREAPLEVMRDALAGRLGRPASSIPMVPDAIGRLEHAGSLG